MTDTITRTPSLVPEGPIPPQALEAERAIIAAMLLNFEAAARAIELIDSRVFYRVAHQKIFDAIIALFNRNEKPDLVTLPEELRKRGDLEAVGGTMAISQILEYAATTVNLDQHVKIVHGKSVLRSLIGAAGEIQQECYAGTDETPAILDRAEHRIFQITDQRVRQGFVSMKELMMPTMKHIEELSERKAFVTGVPSGYDDLDKMTAGFQNSDLVIIAGRPSMGKTSFALNIAENAAIHHAKSVAILSLEMSKEQIALRLLCSQAEVPLFKVRSGHLNEQEHRRLAHLTGGLYKAPIMIDDTAAPTVLEIRAKCRRLRAEKRLDLVMIDYLQLIRGGERLENRNQEISQITRALKALAKELDIPIVALSQLSRAPESRGATEKRPQLSDLRESGCLTADSRIVRADNGAEVSLGELLASGARDVPVWTLDRDLKLVEGRMTHVFPSGIKPVFELRLASGLAIKASANHPFLTMDGWRRLDQLVEGSRLAVPRRVTAPLAHSSMPDEEVVMLAHLIGDGCALPNHPIHYTSADPENIAAVQSAARHFGITPRIVPQENWFHVYLPAPYRLTHGRHNPIASWLITLGIFGLRSYEKFIPRAVFGLDDRQLALFVHHLWATDGCVHRGKGRTPRIYYASTSRVLANDVRSLLLRFGVLSRLKTIRKDGYRPCCHLHITGAANQLRFLEKIGVHGARAREASKVVEFLRDIRCNPNLDTVPVEVWQDVRIGMHCRGVTARVLAKRLGTAYCGSTLYRHSPSRERLHSVATALADPELERLATSDVFWDTVVAIEPLGEQPVFDATVTGTHNFVANGIIVHNSIEQDSDVVLFVYREEMYKRDDPSVRGKAEIIIAKQRNGPTGDVNLTFLHEYTKFVPFSPMMPGENEPAF
jgi:replicative DNA helicase